MEVQIIAKTMGVGPSEFSKGEFENKSIDELIVGQARVSTSREIQELFDEPHKLLRHCILNQHWSIFELANINVKITTSRDIGREILRHGKMTGLTEFSQRYSKIPGIEPIEIRKAHASNRQSSTDRFEGIITLQDGTQMSANDFAKESNEAQLQSYEILLDAVDDQGNYVATETARGILPGATTTVIYLNFRIREFITFLNARLHKTAQKEINEIAEIMAKILIVECPIISKALFNFEHAYEIHTLEQIVLEKHKVRTQVLQAKNLI